MSRTWISFAMGLILAVMLPILPVFGNPITLKSVSNCLTKPPVGINIRYSYSLADRAMNPSYTGSPNVPSQYLLIRVISNPMVVPSYNLIGLKTNTCVNYTPEESLNPQFDQFVHPSVARQFNDVVRTDRIRVEQSYLQEIRSKYPGKSNSDLQKMGVFGLD